MSKQKIYPFDTLFKTDSMLGKPLKFEKTIIVLKVLLLCIENSSFVNPKIVFDIKLYEKKIGNLLIVF
jgi:hypothetical protein